jgi:hypothetical protein
MDNDRAADRRVAFGLVAAALATAAAMALTSPPEDPQHATALAGLPRLGLYLTAALLLAWTSAPGLAPRWAAPAADAAGARPGHGQRRRGGWLAGWLSAALALAIVNVARLRQDIGDALGPGLWLASMLLVVVAVAPSLLPDAPSTPHGGDRRRPLRWLLLAAIVAIAVAARAVALDGVPMNLQADEGDRAATALAVLDGVAPRSWFDSGWYYINMVYFRLLAATFSVLGVGVAQGRALNAVAGSVLVLAVAWIGCRHFSWRLGLIAVALAATGAYALQFSRTIMESGILATLWGVSVAGLLEGWLRGRAWPFALAGLCGGLSLYTYPSARLWAVGAALTLAALWWRGRGHRWAITRGAVICGIAALIAALPFLAHLEQHPHEAAFRYQETTVLSAENQTRLDYTRPEMPLPELMTIQLERSLGMFDRYSDGSAFLPTERPLFPGPLAALTLVGAFYALARGPRDPRLAVLSVWFWLGLSGVILTVETPAAQRAAGLLATLPLLAAIVLDEAAARLPLVARAIAGARATRSAAALDAAAGRAAGATAAGLGLVVALVAAWQAHSYFGVYGRMTEPWAHATNEGRQVAALGALGPVYSIEIAEHMVNAGWVRFLARGTRTSPIPNPGRQLPILPDDDPSLDQPEPGAVIHTPRAGEGMSFLLYGANQTPYLDLLRALYDGGASPPPMDERVAYQLPAAAVDRSRGVTLLANGIVLGQVATFGELPAGMPSPGRLEWRAGVRFGRSGRHRIEIVAPRAATLSLDGVNALETEGGAPARRDIMLARGLHFVSLVAEVQTAGDAIALRRSPLLETAASDAPLRAFRPEETYSPMEAPWGLLARAIPEGEDGASPQADAFLDATLAAAFLDRAGPLPDPGQIVWRGTLLAPRSGTYRMAFGADAPITLELDGQPIEIQQESAETWAQLRQGTPVELTAGAHQVRVTMAIPPAGRTLIRWIWALPAADGQLDADAAWSIVPPMRLRPETPWWPAEPS